MRRGAGAVERGGLENRCALTGTEGSNPSLSAISLSPAIHIGPEYADKLLYQNDFLFEAV